MSNITVGISDWKICGTEDTLVTYALGSCIGTCIYDKDAGIAGMSHIMLPDSKSMRDGNVNRMKFADTALPDMVKEMVKRGASMQRLTAKIAGGAVMFPTQNQSFNIGGNNIQAVKKALAALKIPIVADDTGLNFGRTVYFNGSDGRMIVRSTVKGIVTF
ncbi:MAG: chemotaxis protein CheD [Oscillospiraceae bacterium]|nr:chemotaxis protein CheD [Oscillospiraceae bacterium]